MRDPKNPLVKGTTMDGLINTAAKRASRERTEEIVDFVRAMSEEEQSPGSVYHYMKMARSIEQEFKACGQEDEDG